MAEPALSEDNLDLILEKMYSVKGWDFRRYRKSSLKRCVERRLAFSRLPCQDYIVLRDNHPREFNILFNHITIKVSEFFRDPNVDPILRGQFFKTMALDKRHQVMPLIRNLVTFGIHDLVSNIHLAHMDIILCRNLLICFEKDLQEKGFEKFCYSLNRGGFIILGKSEVVPSVYRNIFREVSRREKIYQKI